ncbi:hypothetical protein ACFE04_005520 [Oxalis oulophora]
MVQHVPIILALVAISILCVILFLLTMFWKRFCCFKQSSQRHDSVFDSNNNNNNNNSPSLQEGIARLHGKKGQNITTSSNFITFRRGASTRPLFNWNDHPTLVTDAVENGWSRFGFTGFMSSASTKTSLLGLCVVSDSSGKTSAPDITWEVSQGSADFMQKIRINPGFKKANFVNNNSYLTATSVIRAALPLPGPSSAFPQEAYFEITILCDDFDNVGKDSEKTKLIKEGKSNAWSNSESLVHAKIEELKLNVKDDGKGEGVVFSVGLTAGGSLPLKHPGTYPGSIGFNSNGSVYLDGIKLVLQSESAEWGRSDKVIGCGYNPREKKVFFTVDSELVHVIHCKTEEYGTPLYPTLAANADILVLVNFGQSVFSYPPANVNRTANPCFIGPVVRNSAALGYEDSKELFSMGRIDSQWLNRSAFIRGSVNTSNGISADFDEESESDLFEIVLDSSSGRRTPLPTQFCSNSSRGLQ